MKKNKKVEKIKNYIQCGIYVIVFIMIVIGILIMDNNKEEVKESDEKETSSVVSKNNYSYEYKLTVNNDTYTYVGKKFNQKEQFSISDGKKSIMYFIYGDLTLMKKNNELVLCDKPYYLFDYFDLDVIDSVIKMASYNKDKKQYELTSMNFGYAFDEEIEDDGINTIKIEHNKDNVSKIKIDFTNYAIGKGEPVNIVYLELTYNDYQKIKDFEIK